MKVGGRHVGSKLGGWRAKCRVGGGCGNEKSDVGGWRSECWSGGSPSAGLRAEAGVLEEEDEKEYEEEEEEEGQSEPQGEENVCERVEEKQGRGGT